MVKEKGKPKVKTVVISCISILMSFVIAVGAFYMLLKNRKFIMVNSYAGVAKSEVSLPNYDTEEVLGTVNRVAPDTFGDYPKEYYPSYTNPLSKSEFTDERKLSIYNENMSIINSTNENIQNGTFAKNLKKHNSADSQFFGGVPDDAPRIVKRVTINHKIPRRHTLGVFAPAGEVLTVTIDEGLVGKGLSVIVGYPYAENNVANTGYFPQMANNKMPYMYLEFKLTSTETKIGSPFGGMVVLSNIPGGIGEDFDITISGGVNALSYKFGVSTKQDWKNILASPTPFIWVMTPYIYHVVPRVYVTSIDDPYDALMFWYKSSMLSFYTIAREDSTLPIISVYDSYVPVGGAVAFVGAYFCILPMDWSAGLFDYKQIMTRENNWGALHEFNHHNQSYNIYSASSWGAGGSNGEVTNNVLNALSYILFTDIALYRRDTSTPGWAWAVCSDPYYNYKKLLYETGKVSTFDSLSTNILFAYVDLIHTFGAAKFVDFIRAMYGKGEGYGEKSLMGFNNGEILKEDGFTVFASKFFKTDFTDYFTNVWHFNLDPSTVEEIKSYNYDEYFTLNNVYSSGVKGVETGRAYRVLLGVENVLNFKEYTLSNADSFKVSKIGKCKYGTLKDNGDGTYTYKSDSGVDFKEEVFDVEYEVELNGKTYKRTLVFRFVPEFNYIKKVTYSAPEGRSLDIREALGLLSDDTKLSEEQASNLTDVKDGYTVTYFRTNLMFSESKTLTFMVYGDDKTFLKINGEEAFTNSYNETLQNAINTTTNKITVDVTADEPFLVEAYCYNTGGRGRFYFKYSEDGETYIDVPVSNCYVDSVTREMIDYQNQNMYKVYPAFVDISKNYLNNFYEDKSYVSDYIESIKCLDNDGNEVYQTPDTSINYMFDGDKNTSYHTAYQGRVTPFPHNYYIEFSEKQSFNQIDFYFHYSHAGEGYYIMKDFDLYFSDDGVEYELFYSGTNSVRNCFLKLDKTINTKYIKLVIKNNGANQIFTCIDEIEFSKSIDYAAQNYNFYGSSDENLIYQGDWKTVSGNNFVNGNAASSNGGSLEFFLYGSDITIYGINKNSVIYIDDIAYKINESVDVSTPCIIIDGLSGGRHRVRIESQEFVLNAIKTSGRIANINIDNSKESISSIAETIGLTLAIFIFFAVGLFILVVLIVKFTKKKKEEKLN